MHFDELEQTEGKKSSVLAKVKAKIPKARNKS